MVSTVASQQEVSRFKSAGAFLSVVSMFSLPVSSQSPNTCGLGQQKSHPDVGSVGKGGYSEHFQITNDLHSIVCH